VGKRESLVRSEEELFDLTAALIAALLIVEEM